MIEAITGPIGIYAGSFVIAVLSGVIPVINAELYLIAVVLLTGNVPAAIVLGVLVAAGQMLAKAGIYHAARGAANLGRKGPPKGLDRARGLIEKWRSKPLTLIFISASAGLPPFYVVSIVAGMLDIRFRAFMLVGLGGRTLRFVTIAVVAVLA